MTSTKPSSKQLLHNDTEPLFPDLKIYPFLNFAVTMTRLLLDQALHC